WALALSPERSPDRSLLAVSGTRGKESFVRLYSSRNNKIVRTISQGHPTAHSLAFSSDGTRLYQTRLQDTTIHVHDVSTGKELSAFVAHDKARPAHLAVSPDGKRLAFTTGPGSVRVWDPLTQKEESRVTMQSKPSS